MLKVGYYAQDVESHELRSENTLTVEEAKKLWNTLLQQGYTLEKEGVLSNGVRRYVFAYTGYFVP